MVLCTREAGGYSRPFACSVERSLPGLQQSGATVAPQFVIHSRTRTTKGGSKYVLITDETSFVSLCVSVKKSYRLLYQIYNLNILSLKHENTLNSFPMNREFFFVDGGSLVTSPEHY